MIWGLGARSQARIISGIKAFFKYLILEGIIDDDPASLLEGPRPGRKATRHTCQPWRSTASLKPST